MALKAKKTIKIPNKVKHKIVANLGVFSYKTRSFYKGSDTAKVRQIWSKEGCKHDGGIATIGGAFCVAMTSTFGAVGDLCEVVLEKKKKSSFWVVICDDKNQSEAKCNKWGHIMTKDGAVDILEWYGDFSGKTLSAKQNQLYKTLKNKGFLGEKINKIINYGAYKSGTNVGGRASEDGVLFGWPAPGYSSITSDWGWRVIWGKKQWHQGIDIGQPSGKKVAAAADGRVVSYASEGGRGNTMVLSHGGGYYTRYQHLSSNVSHVGDDVKRGDKIALSGTTGDITGAHLHFEVLIGGKYSMTDGKHDDVNPEKYVKYDKLVLAPLKGDPNWDGVGSTYDDDSEAEGGGTIDMRQRIAQLYSSDNYEFIFNGKEENKKSPTQKLRESLEKSYKNIKENYEKNTTDHKKAFQDFLTKILAAIADALDSTSREIKVLEQHTERKKNSFFNITKYLVEAPYIELNIGGYKIGGYKGSLDLYPNYITGMSIDKTSGELNEYTIHLVHQVRVGDDPNALDKVFSKNQFNKITIKYGDSTSGATFKDTNAIINNVSMNRDYASAKIMYTINATSAGHFVTAHSMNFEALDGKPSDRIRKLLYNSSISSELLEAFPAMKSKTIASKLIPSNDAPIHMDKVTNTDPITYINYLVSCMSNASEKNKTIKNSVYFIYYTDDAKKGAGFEIREVKKGSISNNYNAVYEVNVGYPNENNIFGFQLTNNQNWSIMYDSHMSKAQDEYYYTIEGSGNIKKIYSPALSQSSDEMQEVDKNWWTFMTQFPVTATLTMRGLLRPAFLTNYIKINTVFYGQKHISSGLYTILEQKDTLDGNGFRTNFSLIRVGDE